ncbi:hypothetical protein [Streptosporangium longisporum]|uniref:Uncharacterized protein n=1 Tax=Streptosporangium longisporum TaxID=46187 RepID=A0ABN3XTM7_9ACTN
MDTKADITAADTSRPPSTRPSFRTSGRWHFAWHFAEMVIAMIAGMLLFGQVWAVVSPLLGWSDALARADLAAMVMATDMTLGMAIWMRVRGHDWPSIAEMGAAMFVPFLVLLVPFWTGALSGDGLMIGGHLLMLPAMLVAMLLRRKEYSRPHRRPACAAPPADAGAGRRITAWLVHRWPSWLALVITIDSWGSSSAPPAWILVILAGAYLVIGAARKHLREPGVLALQLGVFAAYVALAAVAMSVGGNLSLYLVAAGWLAHAGWDIIHYRADKVVPRAYAEACIVIDTIIGLTILLMLW